MSIFTLLIPGCIIPAITAAGGGTMTVTGTRIATATGVSAITPGMVPSMILSMDHGTTHGMTPGIIIIMATTPMAVIIAMAGGIIPAMICQRILIHPVRPADWIGAVIQSSTHLHQMFPV